MEIHKIACVGAGLIGHGWATLFVWKGYEVALHDKSERVLENAEYEIRRNLEFLAEKKMIRKETLQSSLGRIAPTTNLKDAVKEVDYVQESVYESYRVKKKTFEQLDAVAPPHTIIASSTSSLKMSIIQKATKNPGRCIVAHPWNPPHIMPLVEIIPGKKTARETVDATRRFMERLGKVPVLQKKEVPGTLGNRLAAALWREAIHLVDRGVADLEDVDKAVSAGPGLRWAVLGPHLSYHLGGGEGGIERFLEHLGPAMESRWKSLAKWTSLSSSARWKIVRGVKQSRIVREKGIEDLARWRDDRLVELLKILYPQNDA